MHFYAIGILALTHIRRPSTQLRADPLTSVSIKSVKHCKFHASQSEAREPNREDGCKALPRDYAER